MFYATLGQVQLGFSVMLADNDDSTRLVAFEKLGQIVNPTCVGGSTDNRQAHRQASGGVRTAFDEEHWTGAIQSSRTPA